MTRIMLTKTMTKWNLLAALVFGTSFWACSGDKTAGTDEQSEGLYAIKNLDIAGVSQKGPFVKGSAVTVQGIDYGGKWINYLAGVAIIIDKNGNRRYVAIRGLKSGYAN